MSGDECWNDPARELQLSVEVSDAVWWHCRCGFALLYCSMVAPVCWKCHCEMVKVSETDEILAMIKARRCDQ